MNTGGRWETAASACTPATTALKQGTCGACLQAECYKHEGTPYKPKKRGVRRDKEHEQMMDMVRSAMEIAESRGNYAASVRLLFDATVDVMQLEVNGKVYTLRAGEEKALRAAVRDIGRATQRHVMQKRQK